MALHGEGRVVVRGGADLVKYRPVFSTDSKYVFICSGFVVKVFSTASGECVRELKGHSNNVTGIVVNPQNKLQVFTSSLDKTIKQWDYVDSVLLRTLKVGSPVHGLFAHTDISDSLLATTGENQNAKTLVRISIPKKLLHSVEVNTHHLMVDVQGGDKAVAVGSRGEFIVCFTRNLLRILFLEGKDVKKLSPDAVPITCIACHPTDYCIAAGDVKGRISIWHNFHQKAIRALEHWHSLRVEDLCYSPEGSTLYSVGHECTLVEWQHKTLKRSFLPRQGAPIRHVTCSPNSQQRALSLMTNAILIQVHHQTTQTVQGFVHTNFNHLRDGYLPAGLVVDPRTRALVTNGMIGQLQFYMLEEDRLLFSLDISGENYISPSELSKPLVHTEVEKVAFDQGAMWMATVERRDDQITSSEMRLKMWEFDEQKQSFVLNTIISQPHQGPINTLHFRPIASRDVYEPMVVSVSDGGKFKIWKIVDDGDSQQKSQSWGCDSVGFFRDQKPRCACFSSDGSLLAVGFGHIVTMWEPDLNILKKTLCHGTTRNCIEHVVFGHGSAAHCLVSASSSLLNVWNLTTCTVMWNVDVDVSVLTSDPLSEYLATFDSRGNLFVFHPSNPELVYKHDDAVTSSTVMDAVFVPRTSLPSTASDESGLLPWETQSQLYLVTRSLDLLTVTGDAEALNATRGMEHADLEDSILPTPFAVLLTNQRRSDDADEQPIKRHELPASTSIREMLNSSAHILPPVKSLCSIFLKELLDLHTEDDKRESESESEDEVESNQSSETDDSETEQLNKSRSGSSKSKEPADQSRSEVRSSDDDDIIRDTAELSLQDSKKLTHDSKSGLRWMHTVFEDIY